MLKKATLFAILLIGLTAGYAQEAVNAAGNSASGKGGSISWSVGQVLYTTNTGKTGSVTQGVQQVYKISFIETRQAFSSSFSVFPNPVADNLILQTPGFKTERLSYQLFDIQGKIVKSDLVTGTRTEINTSALPAATYFLFIIQGNKHVQSFKIIKN